MYVEVRHLEASGESLALPEPSSAGRATVCAFETPLTSDIRPGELLLLSLAGLHSYGNHHRGLSSVERPRNLPAYAFSGKTPRIDAEMCVTLGACLVNVAK